MRLDTSGNLGLGVTPSAWNSSFRSIDLQNGGSLSGFTNGFWLTSNGFYNSGGTFIYKATASASAYAANSGSHQWYTAPSGTAGNAITFTQAMTLDASGNLGIGSTSIATVGAYRVLDLNNTSGGYLSMSAAGTRVGAFYSNPTSTGVESLGARYIEFIANGAERMRIDSSGIVFIGKTTDNINNVGVQISPIGAAAFTRNTASGFVGYWNIQGGSGGIQEFYLSNVAKGSISVAAGGTTYNTTSDYRLKENVQPMTGALGVVSQLKPVTYNWKADGSSGQGFIAHELQAVVPDCVTGDKDATELVDIKNEDGNVIGQETKPVYQGIDTSFLVATLTAAIQELNAKVTALEAQLNK
jgi:hypothetical protein